MDVQDLRAFVKVVQLGSFTRAAEALSTQKAHLSRLVSQLEHELGVRLLQRSTRSLSLTEVGKTFFAHASGILESIDDAYVMVQQAKGAPHGTLKLSCGVEFGLIAVSDWIDLFLSRYPQVRVEADFSGKVVDLIGDGIDLAIRLGPLNDSSLHARKLGELHYGLYAAPHYIQQYGVPEAPEHLVGHQTLVFNGGSHRGVWRLFRQGQEKQVLISNKRQPSGFHV